MYACEKGKNDVVEILLSHPDIDINLQDIVIHQLIMFEFDISFMKFPFFIINGIVILIVNNTALILAAANGSVKSFKALLLKEGIQINAKGVLTNTLLCNYIVSTSIRFPFILKMELSFN